MVNEVWDVIVEATKLDIVIVFALEEATQVYELLYPVTIHVDEDGATWKSEVSVTLNPSTEVTLCWHYKVAVQLIATSLT